MERVEPSIREGGRVERVERSIGEGCAGVSGGLNGSPDIRVVITCLFQSGRFSLIIS